MIGIDDVKKENRKKKIFIKIEKKSISYIKENIFPKFQSNKNSKNDFLP
jgi:hypothetical protein